MKEDATVTFFDDRMLQLEARNDQEIREFREVNNADKVERRIRIMEGEEDRPEVNNYYLEERIT